jgi:hypothetical protein
MEQVQTIKQYDHNTRNLEFKFPAIKFDIRVDSSNFKNNLQLRLAYMPQSLANLD